MAEAERKEEKQKLTIKLQSEYEAVMPARSYRIRPNSIEMQCAESAGQSGARDASDKAVQTERQEENRNCENLNDRQEFNLCGEPNGERKSEKERKIYGECSSAVVLDTK